ncbi:zinc finger transcription factor lin-29-like isoform X3 [Dreissena polymorpha]|uniref:zinc finger transcription factor lin-29-like isoform X3 n=1 Tax=Dreissena polymorpha TaxID=45954 RepID=UPI002264B1D3|nr:zinc finger transcription factor lin-29-like isoform X3 [Dreissena polymorpha]
MHFISPHEPVNDLFSQPLACSGVTEDLHSKWRAMMSTNDFLMSMINHTGNITSDAMNNNLHHLSRHESTSSNGSYRSNGATSGLNTPTTPGNNGASSLVIPQPVKPSNMKQASKTYQCKMCEQIFSTKSDLLIHCQQIHKQDMKTFRWAQYHIIPSAFRCPQCQKCFANSSYLSQHNRIHAGIKPYKCDICDRKFTQLSHLQQHIRTHTGEKPYKCHHTGCGKAFSQLSNLQSHSRSHMTDRPYRCNSCYKCYADEAGLREHIPKHSETKHIKTQICKVCGKAYTQETYLARHMLKHTGENSKLLVHQGSSVKQEPSDQSSLDAAVDFTRLLDRVDRMTSSAQDMSSSGIKPPGTSMSSAFMPLAQFCSSNGNSSSYPYGTSLNSGLQSALNSSNLSPSLPHISSMSNPRYFPYDPLGFRKSDPVDRLVNERLANDRFVNERLVNERLVNDRLVNERLVNERLERNLNVQSRQENVLANSFLSLQHIKNYASQQMQPSFSPCPNGNSRLT